MLTDSASTQNVLETRLGINLYTGWQTSSMLVSHDIAYSSSERPSAIMATLSGIVYSTASGHLFGTSIVASCAASKQTPEWTPIQPFRQVVAILFLNII